MKRVNKTKKRLLLIPLFLLVAVLLVLLILVVSRDDLFDAVANGDLDQVKKLVNSGTDVNKRNNWGRAALHLVAQGNLVAVGERPIPTDELTYIAEFLIAHGANVNARDHFGYTPLCVAAEANNYKVAKVLISHRAETSATIDRFAITPLHTSAGNGDFQLSKLLVENGAQVDAQDDRGETPLHHAVLYYYCDPKKESKDVIELLLKNGADVNAKSKLGETPLKLAVESPQVDGQQIVRLLRKYGPEE